MPQENLTFPVVSANVISKNDKLNKAIKPFQIFEQYQLAVIGVTTPDTADISSVDHDVTSFADVTASVRNAIDLIHSTRPDVKRIIALTHIGYEEDIRLAKETTGLHLIIGGHSHTKLGSAADAEGSYPTIVSAFQCFVLHLLSILPASGAQRQFFLPRHKGLP